MYVFISMKQLLILLVLCSNTLLSQTQTGYPTIYTNDGGVVAFGKLVSDNTYDVTNLESSDNQYEEAVLPNNEQVKGHLGGFGFTIPDGSNIVSATIMVEGRWENPASAKNVRLYVTNGLGKKRILQVSNNSFMLFDETKTYTSIESNNRVFTFNLGTELTPAILSSDDFGINIEINNNVSGKFLLNKVNISVEYLPTTLPVELTSFDAKQDGVNVELIWVTSSEVNNDFFETQRSKDAINWETVAIIEGAGNSNVPIKYSIYDNRPYIEASYYRIKQSDFDGTETYSNKIRVNNMNIANTIIGIYNLSGNPVDITTSGVVIIAYSDNSIKKIINK